MRVAAHIDEARQAARQVLASLRLSTAPKDDEAAVFSFDMNLQSLQPFTADPERLRPRWRAWRPTVRRRFTMRSARRRDAWRIRRRAIPTAAR